MDASHGSKSTVTCASAACRSEQLDSTMEAVVAESFGSGASAEATGDAGCNMVEPEIDFDKHDLFYLAVQYVPLTGQAHLLYHKYMKRPKPLSDPTSSQPAQDFSVPLDKLITTIDMKIYRSSNRELVGSLSRSIELPGALPCLRLPGMMRSLETAGASRVFSLSNIMRERLVQEANAAVAGIPGFHCIFFGLHRVQPGGRFELVSRRVQPISNSDVSDLFAQGVISADHRTEAWTEGRQLRLEFLAPTIGKRKESLGSRFYCK